MTTTTVPADTIVGARTIGRGALVIAIACAALSVGRPLLVMLFGQADDGAFLTPAVAVTPGSQVIGVFVSIVFLAIGAGMLVLRSGLAWLGRATRSTWGDVVLAAALVAAVGYTLVAGLARVMLSVFAGALADTGADAAAQVAALHMGNLVTGAATVTAGAATAVVLVGIATLARRAHVVGLPTAILAWIGAALLVVGFVGFAFGPVQFVTPIVFLVIAVAALRRRRADRS